MVEQTKKDLWIVSVREEMQYKVAFEKDLTEEEALDAFRNNDYEDVLDEYHGDYEILRCV